MHNVAIKCTDKAKELLSSSEEDSVRYACLQMRMAIESLFYDLARFFKEELPTNAFTKWQPKEFLDTLIEIDPDIQNDSWLYFREPDEPEYTLLGVHKKPSRKMLRDHYHKLGFFLHQPVILDLTIFDTEKAKGSVFEKAIGLMEPFRHPIEMMVNFKPLIEAACSLCNTMGKWNWVLFKKPRIVGCRNHECGVHFLITHEKSDEYEIEEYHSGAFYKCVDCKAINRIEDKDFKEGLETTCMVCSKAHRVSTRIGIEGVKR